MIDRLEAIGRIQALIEHMDRAAQDRKELLDKVHPMHRDSALNLVYYLALRAHSIEDLQDYLSTRGLSALRFAESDTYNNLNCVLGWLKEEHDPECTIRYQDASDRLNRNSEALFAQPGPFPVAMVTLSGKRFEKSPEMISTLIAAGMRVARINCGHDSHRTWIRMAQAVRHASDTLGLPCAIHFDLSGPKMRVGSIFQADGSPRRKAGFRIGERIVLSTHKPSKADLKSFDWWLIPAIEGLIEHLEPGMEVFFDDGIASGSVVSVSGDLAWLELSFVETEVVRIKLDAGLNIPGLSAHYAALTDEDRVHLEEILPFAQSVGLSFVNAPGDIADLVGLLEASAYRPGLIVKVETPKAFADFPALLFALMRYEKAGVMIARGDLGLSVGFGRLSEVQEEVLWLCEAANVPAIWATQVLEKMLSKGVPSRAEITDVATAVGAECVMLNKGDHQIEALGILQDILRRMHGHYRKKRLVMRPLSLAQAFWEG